MLCARKENPMASTTRTQIHLELPYKQQPRDHPTVKAYLERGCRIEHLQRLTDRDVLVTFACGSPSQSPATG
jgi:hypothetical protein